MAPVNTTLASHAAPPSDAEDKVIVDPGSQALAVAVEVTAAKGLSLIHI